jgi:hypothetical protein
MRFTLKMIIQFTETIEKTALFFPQYICTGKINELGEYDNFYNLYNLINLLFLFL